MASGAKGSVLVYGGAGQLGAVLVTVFKEASWAVVSVDFRENGSADSNVVLENGASMLAMAQSVKAALAGGQFDAIVNAAGGWAGGAIASEDSFAAIERMMAFNLNSALVASHVASHHLAPSGLLVLTGASAALGPTPGMLGYGLSKVGVHHIVRSLAASDSGFMPHVCAVLPLCLDTPQNRSDMPGADVSSWTPMLVLAAQLLLWASDASSRPPRGALVRVVTSGGETIFPVVSDV
ncbi:MAG: SDR family NAD(P)-dependent oxidoreductase [archaeon]|nr:SDR family NAD(P)-dependent oxidoreductase [archaeon]